MSIAVITETTVAATVTLPTRELHAALVAFDRLLPRRTHIAEMTGVLIESSGDRLTMSTFDYDTHARYTVAVDGGVFRTLVDARSLLKIVRAQTRKAGDDTSFEVTEHSALIVRQGASSATLTALSLDKMIERPAVPAPYRTVDGPAFDAAITRVSVAAGSDDTLPMLTAVNVAHEAASITMASTDRFTLAVDTVHTSVLGTLDAEDVLWPAKTVRLAVKTFGARHGAVDLHTYRQGYTVYVGWSCGAWTIMTRAIDAEFPRYKSLIPTDVEHSFRFDRDGLLSAATAAAATKTRYIEFTVDGDQAAIEYAYGDDATATTSTVVERVHGSGAFRFALNPDYIVDILKTLPAGLVTVSANSPTRPFLFRVDSLTDYTALLMPVRLPAA